ncbi:MULTISPECIES: GNAT family N-acetyltransferase [unclassified Bradyrhizobium]|uniref:GNAT family N-acetyltransferase n=1 Tax=unclassified Bradyrhizobium TaxID=2631580 RepID=UPI0028E71D95|nr:MULTISPECIES: GNAT family N-acetyltransferase [unclassified Bradyrhizobium]
MTTIEAEIVSRDARLRLRRAETADAPFLRDLFKSVKGAQLAAAGLPPAMLDLVLAQQFRAQVAGHATQCPAAHSLIILRDAAPVGRLLLDRAAQRWHVVDLALLPGARNAGVGREIMQAVATAAREQGAEVLSLAVATTNDDAIRFYVRLGFRDVAHGATASHRMMELPLAG